MLVAPLCRVGRSSEPAKAGGTAVIGRASGFLATEACTTRDLAAHLGCYVGSDEPPKTITSKAGALRILARHPGAVKLSKLLKIKILQAQRLVNELFELKGPLVEFPLGGRLRLPRPEVFVGEVQGDEDCEAEGIGGWRRFGDRPHFLVHVCGELDDIGRLQPAPDRVPLPGNVDCDDAAAQMDSSCNSISETRSRIASRSARSASSSACAPWAPAIRPRSMSISCASRALSS